LDQNVLNRVNGTALFYPCSGDDLHAPIRMFAPHVKDFWFVDRGYFAPGHQDTKRYGMDVDACRAKPVLAGNPDYELVDTTIYGPSSWNPGNRDIEPCILKETYRHLPSGKQIRVRRRRGYGFSAFRTEIRQIGVFFYRGDSPGEGGSGNLWLKSSHVDEICAKLIDGGLLVTDGSQQCNWPRQASKSKYGPLAQYHFGKKPCPVDPEEIVRTTKPFQDPKGRRFNCVGYAGKRYGPTLVWKVEMHPWNDS